MENLVSTGGGGGAVELVPLMSISLFDSLGNIISIKNVKSTVRATLVHLNEPGIVLSFTPPTGP